MPAKGRLESRVGWQLQSSTKVTLAYMKSATSVRYTARMLNAGNKIFESLRLLSNLAYIVRIFYTMETIHCTCLSTMCFLHVWTVYTKNNLLHFFERVDEGNTALSYLRLFAESMKLCLLLLSLFSILALLSYRLWIPPLQLIVCGQVLHHCVKWNVKIILID